jgi:DNA-binding GntR family transcriptional regulator
MAKKAIAILSSEGLVHMVQGKGTYVTGGLTGVTSISPTGGTGTRTPR